MTPVARSLAGRRELKDDAAACLARRARSSAIAGLVVLLATTNIAAATDTAVANPNHEHRVNSLADLRSVLEAIAAKSPEVLAAQAVAEQAQAGVQRARAAWFGNVDAYALSQHFNDPRLVRPITQPPIVAAYPFASDQFGYGLEASLPIDISGQIAAGVDAARNKAHLARRQSEDLRLRFLLHGASLYRTLQALAGQRDALAAQLASLLTSERVAVTGLAEGQIAKVSLLRVQAAMAEMRAQLAVVDGETSKARAQLIALTGTEVLDIAVTASADRPCHPPSDTGASPPGLEAAKSALDAAQAKLLGAERAQYPQLALVGGWNRNAIQWDTRAVDTWQVNLVLRFNLWSGGERRNAIGAARAAETEARQRRRAAEEDLRAAREGAVAQWRAQEQSWSAATAGLTHAAENARIERNRFRNGLGSATDLVDAEAALTRARAGVTGALASWWQADDALRYTYGEPPAALSDGTASCAAAAPDTDGAGSDSSDWPQ
jgi:outer membrane protein TolC